MVSESVAAWLTVFSDTFEPPWGPNWPGLDNHVHGKGPVGLGSNGFDWG